MDIITIKLKKMLLSRNVILQDKSIQFMINSLRDPKRFEIVSTTFLNADMVHFLCEPLLSINTPLIQNICLCIWMLSKNNKFYERNDVLYTCNSLLRTIVFLIKTNDPSVSDLIQLLAIIIKKGGTNIQDTCNVSQVLTIIKMIFTNSQHLTDRSVINAISILTSFLSCPSIELSNKLCNTSILISKAICKIVTEKCTIGPHVVEIASNLSSSLLRLYSTITSRVLINDNLKKYRSVANLLRNVAWYMIKHISLPFVLKNMNMNIYYKNYQRAIKSLLSPFKENLSTNALQNIANHYAATKTIKILYELIEYNKIGILVEELLYEMLFYLSSTYLQIDYHWPGGTDMFRNQIIWSFKNFPKIPKDISMVLMKSKDTGLRHSIIIFLYFYLLTSSNVENESIYLEPICVYLCSIETEIPIPVIKAVLFNISISFVSHHAVNAVSGLTFATNKLVEIINSHKMIDFIFTHHPALLYFLFATSIIPNKIQLLLIKHWILNLDEVSSIELEKFCLNNHKGKLCLLNVLVYEVNIDSNKLQLGFNIIKKIIICEKENNDYITLLTIWDMLPIILGSLCCIENPNVIGASNLICLLNLIELYPLSGLNVSINEHRNIVYTMSLIIKSYQYTFTEQFSLLSSLLQHLLTLIRFSNSDVINTVKKHNDFICVLQNLCSSENDNVCFLTFKIIIQLYQIQQGDTDREHIVLYSITLNYEHILNAMTRMCHNCITSSITMFQIIIQYYEQDIYNIIKFSEVPTVEFYKSVFIQLETIISQGLDWVSDYAWECMTKMLSSTFFKYQQQSPELQIYFSTDPWLFCLFANLKSFSEKCLEFLNFWLTRFVFSKEESFTISGDKILCPSVFYKTIIHISITIIQQMHGKSELLSKAKVIINLIKRKLLLPNELECKINSFLSQY